VNILRYDTRAVRSWAKTLSQVLSHLEDNEKVSPSDPTDDFDERLPDSLWKALNLREPRRSDDRVAPEVDRNLLRRLVRKELPNELVRAVYRLIHAFDTWKKAFAEIVIEAFPGNQPPDDDIEGENGNG
jgi:hypothetical protein